MKWTEEKIKISRKYDAATRRLIAQDVIDFIVKRSLSGKDKNNNKFHKYSEGYTKSLDFKNAGKSKKVNLKLSGDMLAELDLLASKKGEITIGYDKSNPEQGKAEGNIRGTYGQNSPIPGKKRDFLGLTRQDLEKIISKYPTRQKELESLLASKLIRERLKEIEEGVEIEQL